jgi:hypothetical protein
VPNYKTYLKLLFMRIKLLSIASFSAAAMVVLAGCGNGAATTSNGTDSTAMSTDTTHQNTTAPKVMAEAPARDKLVATVWFGNPPKGGGACLGNGICDAVAFDPAAKGIADTFEVSDTSNNVLVMRFSIDSLKKTQPEQVAYFKNASKTYTFNGIYDLTVPLYAPLKLQPGAQIDPKSPTVVDIKDGIVKVSITYTHK